MLDTEDVPTLQSALLTEQEGERNMPICSPTRVYNLDTFAKTYPKDKPQTFSEMYPEDTTVLMDVSLPPIFLPAWDALAVAAGQFILLFDCSAISGQKVTFENESADEMVLRWYGDTGFPIIQMVEFGGEIFCLSGFRLYKIEVTRGTSGSDSCFVPWGDGADYLDIRKYGGADQLFGAVFLEDDFLFLLNQGGLVFKVRTLTGELATKWPVQRGTGTVTHGPVIVGTSLYYVQDGQVYGIDLASGTEVLQRPLPSQWALPLPHGTEYLDDPNPALRVVQHSRRWIKVGVDLQTDAELQVPVQVNSHLPIIATKDAVLIPMNIPRLPGTFSDFPDAVSPGVIDIGQDGDSPRGVAYNISTEDSAKLDLSGGQGAADPQQLTLQASAIALWTEVPPGRVYCFVEYGMGQILTWAVVEGMGDNPMSIENHWSTNRFSFEKVDPPRPASYIGARLRHIGPGSGGSISVSAPLSRALLGSGFRTNSGFEGGWLAIDREAGGVYLIRLVSNAGENDPRPFPDGSDLSSFPSIDLQIKAPAIGGSTEEEVYVAGIDSGKTPWIVLFSVPQPQ